MYHVLSLVPPWQAYLGLWYQLVLPDFFSVSFHSCSFRILGSCSSYFDMLHIFPSISYSLEAGNTLSILMILRFEARVMCLPVSSGSSNKMKTNIIHLHISIYVSQFSIEICSFTLPHLTAPFFTSNYSYSFFVTLFIF